MRLDEAKELARTLRSIENVTIIGVKSYEDEKALIISFNRKGRVRIVAFDGALGKVAKAAGVKGHTWERLNVCSLCYRTLKSEDGHYHSVRNAAQITEGVCCRCVRKSGAKCSIRARLKRTA